MQTQITCYQAFRIAIELTPPEKDVIIQETNCFREDAMAFCKYLYGILTCCTNEKTGSFLEKDSNRSKALKRSTLLLENLRCKYNLDIITGEILNLL